MKFGNEEYIDSLETENRRLKAEIERKDSLIKEAIRLEDEEEWPMHPSIRRLLEKSLDSEAPDAR
jgi:hypothetical protein